MTPLRIGWITAASACLVTALGLRGPVSRSVDVTVTEGTSMAVTASPDGRSLAIDLQGAIWIVPSAGGVARRITDGFDDARQPSWSPDGQLIAFHGYRDGGYDLWLIAPDGSGQRKLTADRFDDREAAWSRDGSRIAFASDRAADGNYDIWTIDVRSGVMARVTTSEANDYMPSWSPGDSALAFASTREGSESVWIHSLMSGAERRHSPTGVTAGAPSWSASGEIVYHAGGAARSRLETLAGPLTGEENAFPFRAAWLTPSEFIYTSDGKIRQRTLGGGEARTLEFSATFQVSPASYTRRPPLDATSRRRALGILSPVISPDGRSVAFAALGDLWLMDIGSTPRKLTDDPYMETEPAWSPDGGRIAYSSDKGGGLLNLWVLDRKTGTSRQLTRLETSAMGAAWSPDGSRIAFLDVDGVWRRASVSVVDVATGTVTKIHESSFGPGTPTWSRDGAFVVVAALDPYSSRFREGTNQLLRIPVAPADSAQAITLFADRSIDSRAGAGPAWSPDGTSMAVINAGVLTVVPVSGEGRPVGPPRKLTSEIAHAPSWTADSRRILYQSNDRLRLMDVARGVATDVPFALTYAPAVRTERTVVHAGAVVDATSPTIRRDMDIVVVGNRIRSVQPHDEAAHRGAPVVDAAGLTVMPGLIEYHSHLQKDMASAHGRAWLAFGITTVRNPGSTPYEGVEDREAVEAGVRPGPRVFTAGYLMEWERSYYKMSVTVADQRHLALELQRARVLRHDMLKSYVRMPDLQQRRMVDFAHSIGIPASSHEIYPSTFVGIDGVEHTTGTSRRGYSPKAATLQRSYADVAALMGAARVTFTPTLLLGGAWFRRMLDADSSLRSDPRKDLLAPWIRSAFNPQAGRGAGGGGGPGGGAAGPGSASGAMIMAAHKAGARVVAGTDTPNPANLHAELLAYVAAGMSPLEALRSATITPAEALSLDAGRIQPGRIADLVAVRGNPLEDIGNAIRVEWTMADGKLYRLTDLIGRP
jgi:Tol biopolymer transport system component